MSSARIVPASDMSNAEYHALPDIGSSTLKEWLGPARYTGLPREPKKAWDIGTCIHSLALEGRVDWVAPFTFERPESLDAEAPEALVVAMDALRAAKVTRRSKADGDGVTGAQKWAPLDEQMKSWKSERADALRQWEAARDAAQVAYDARIERDGLYVLKDADAELVRGVVAAVEAHPIASAMIAASPENESSIFWVEVVEVDGQTVEIPCKCRPDLMPRIVEDGRDVVELVDLKSIDAHLVLSELGRAAARFNYPFSMAWYRRGMRAHGLDPERCLIIWASKKQPFGCEVTEIHPDDLDRQERRIDAALRNYARHQLNPQRYDGFADALGRPTITTLALPGWYARDTEGAA